MANMNIEKFKELKIDLKDQIQKIGEDNCNQLKTDVYNNATTILDKGYATGVYASGWIVEPTDEGAILKNTGRDATLAHLLENGHRSRNGSWVPPQPHIRPAYQKVRKQYLEDIYEIKIKAEFK